MQKLAEFVPANTKIGASSPTPSIPGDDQQFEYIVRSVEILVGDRNKRSTHARDDMAAASEVMQAVEVIFQFNMRHALLTKFFKMNSLTCLK